MKAITTTKSLHPDKGSAEKENRTRNIDQEGSENITPRDRSYIFIKSARSYIRLDYDDIYYLKAVGSYCLIVTASHEYTVATNLKNFLEQTAEAGLVRCHRSYAVNVDNIREFDDICISMYTHNRTIEIPMSNSYRKSLLSRLPRLRSQ